MSDMEKRFNEAKALYNRKQYDDAAPLLEALAEEGYADAQYLLGISFERGRGVMQDYDKAVEWYRKAAMQGNEDAKGWFDKPKPAGKMMQSSKSYAQMDGMVDTPYGRISIGEAQSMGLT